MFIIVSQLIYFLLNNNVYNETMKGVIRCNLRTRIIFLGPLVQWLVGTILQNWSPYRSDKYVVIND